MKIRKVRVGDLNEIAKLRKETFDKFNSSDYTKEQIAYLNSNTPKKLKEKMKQRDMFCLEDSGKILGIVDLEGDKLGGLFVRSDKLGKGYGQMLLDFIEDYARKKGLNKVRLYSTKHACGFYKKNGYSIIFEGLGKEFSGLRFYERIMEKELK